MAQRKQKLPHNHLAEGEVTGHYHAAEGASAVYELAAGVREFDARSGEVMVTHQEHRAIPMPAKVMHSARIREYDSFAEEAREVRD